MPTFHRHTLADTESNNATVPHDLERDPTVTCTVVNLSNPYEFASIEGRMIERTTDGADDHIDFLARKYLGLDQYPFHSAAEPRVLIRIRPDRILHMAPEDTNLPTSS